MDEFQPQIRINLINYPPEFSSPGQAAYRQLIQAIDDYVRGLWAQLGLVPVVPNISVTSDDSQHNLWGDAVYTFSINGFFCPSTRIERSVARAKTMAPSVLAREICFDIFDYRGHIIESDSFEGVIQLANDKYPANGWQQVATEIFQTICRQWIATGLNIDRLLTQPSAELVSFVEAKATRSSSFFADWLFEAAAQSLKNYRLAVALPTGPQQEPTSEFAQSLHKIGRIYNTPLPELQILSDPQIPEGFINFIINDAPSPRLPNNDESLSLIKERIVERNLHNLQCLALTQARFSILMDDEWSMSPYFQNNPGLLEITAINRQLLRERLRINFSAILQSYLEINQVATTDTSKKIVFPSPVGLMSEHLDVNEVTELSMSQKSDVIRSSLAREISFQYAPEGSLNVLLLDINFEEMLRIGLWEDWPANVVDEMVRAIWKEYRPLLKERPAILTTMDIREMLASMIRIAMPGLPVLAYQDLSPTLSITPLARVYLD